MQTGVKHDDRVGEDIGCVCEGEGEEENGVGESSDGVSSRSHSRVCHVPSLTKLSCIDITSGK